MYSEQKHLSEISARSNNKRIRLSTYNCHVVGKALACLNSGNYSMYFDGSNLSLVSERAEAKLESLGIPPKERMGAKLAYHPDGPWAKAHSFDKPLPTIELERGASAWYLNLRDAKGAYRVRGEVLMLTRLQHKRVIAELESKFVVMPT